jgi:hypothetical protein
LQSEGRRLKRCGESDLGGKGWRARGGGGGGGYLHTCLKTRMSIQHCARCWHCTWGVVVRVLLQLQLLLLLLANAVQCIQHCKSTHPALLGSNQFHRSGLPSQTSQQSGYNKRCTIPSQNSNGSNANATGMSFVSHMESSFWRNSERAEAGEKNRGICTLPS